MSDDAVDYSGTISSESGIRSLGGVPFDCAAYHVGLSLQTSMGDDILQMIVCLRDGKEAVEHLKARYPEEANNVALDIKTKFKLGELALQHQASSASAS
jgi:hypothetical protein